jgi:hypothetical protein
LAGARSDLDDEMGVEALGIALEPAHHPLAAVFPMMTDDELQDRCPARDAGGSVGEAYEGEN